MKSLIILLLTFVVLDNSIKLCSSHPNILTTIEKDIGKTMKEIPRVVNDAAPYVSQLPIVGPVAGLGRAVGTELGGALGIHKQGTVPGIPGYPPGGFPNRRFPGTRMGPVSYPATGRMGGFRNFDEKGRIIPGFENPRFSGTFQDSRQPWNFEYPRRPLYPGYPEYPLRKKN